MSKKDFSVALKYVEARPRSQRRKGTEARVSGISVVGSGVSATDLSLLQANLISVTNNFTALKDLFDSMFEKDSDGNIHAKLSLWSSGGITAGGVGSGGSGGGGALYDRLDAWSDYSADKSGWVLSALLGNDLNTRLSSIENAGYITQSALVPYALRSEIPSLVGYATQSWVESKNYLTGITSSMVTTALGYTPYNSANFTKANIKSTLGISDWALASAKPAYTASEVGALGVNATAVDSSKLGGYASTSYMRASGQYFDSLNDLTTLGIYRMGGTITDGPTGAGSYGNLMVVRSNSWDTLAQLYFNVNNNRVFVRSGSNTSYPTRDWSAFAFTSDIPTKLSQLTDDVVVGKYLPLSGGTVNGDLKVSGVATLGSLVRLIETDGSTLYKVIQRNSGGNILLGSDYTRDLYIDFDKVRVRSNGTIFSREVTAPTFVGNLTGNANSATYILTKLNDAFYPDKYKAYIQWVSEDTAVMKFTDGDYQFRANSATKLATPRTIWGQSFDGTQDITGALTSSSIIKASSFFSTSISIECGANGVVDPITYGGEINRFSSNLYLQNRGGNIYLSHASGTTYIRGKLNGVGATFTDTLTVPSITIGGVTITYDSVNEALCINGNMYALGGITAGGTGISTYSSLEARVARLEQQLNIS